MKPHLVLSFCAALASATFAHAQKRDSGVAVVDELLACRAIAAPDARLACFDRGAAAFDAAKTARKVRVVDQETVRKAKRSLFGLTLADLNPFGGKDDDDGVPEIKEIASTVSSVADRRYGMYAITLADNSYWAFIEELPEAPRKGDTIKIRRGSLGSFIGSINGRNGARIKRER